MTWETPTGPRVLTTEEIKLLAFAAEESVNTIYRAEFQEGSKPLYDEKQSLTFGPFETLEDSIKHALMKSVLENLFTETPCCPRLTAHRESCIYFLFAYLKKVFENDVHSGEERWGLMIEQALDATAHLQPDEKNARLAEGQMQDGGNDYLSESDDDDDDESKEGDSASLEHKTNEGANSKNQNMQSHRKAWSIVQIGCHDNQKWTTALDILADNILWDREFEQFGEFSAGFSIISDEKYQLALEYLDQEDQEYYRDELPPSDPAAKSQLNAFLLSFISRYEEAGRTLLVNLPGIALTPPDDCQAAPQQPDLFGFWGKVVGNLFSPSSGGANKNQKSQVSLFSLLSRNSSRDDRTASLSEEPGLPSRGESSSSTTLDHN
mmetsp:Transcript_17109/g.30096  ORF Transcript_17109/g.30096 Transcript_17109/m.30096 type:complete len:379 (+) Transcript_17109:97-1233(+)